MERMFESLSIFEFQELFPDDRACLEYLIRQRWGDGFVCSRCGHTHFCRHMNESGRECTGCRAKFSPTSGTIFHRLKFPILKAFWIIYYMSTNKKGSTAAS